MRVSAQGSLSRRFPNGVSFLPSLGPPRRATSIPFARRDYSISDNPDTIRATAPPKRRTYIRTPRGDPQAATAAVVREMRGGRAQFRWKEGDSGGKRVEAGGEGCVTYLKHVLWFLAAAGGCRCWLPLLSLEKTLGPGAAAAAVAAARAVPRFNFSRQSFNFAVS